MAEPSVELNRLTDAQVETLCLEFEIQSNHETVKDAIDNAAMRYEAIYRWQHEPPKKEQCERLNEILRHSKALRAVLRELSERERLLLSRYDPDLQLHQLRDSLRTLANVTEMALHDAESAPSRRGQHKADLAGRELVNFLLNFYRAQTGKEPKTTYSGDLGKYTDPFVSFVERVSELLGVQKKNSFIGDTLKKLKRGV